MDMTPTRPYFVQAIFDWILDNELTPFLSVSAEYPSTEVPFDFVEDGQITLNISPSAVHNFYLDKEAISFQARFSGASMSVYVPMGAIIGLYAKENGHGMAFPEEQYYLELAEKLMDQDDALSVVAAVDEEESLASELDSDAPESEPEASKPEASKAKSDSKGKAKGSHLRVIK